MEMTKLCFSLLLLLQLCMQPAASHSTVTFLPGFHGPLPFELETGYVGVGESEEAQLFYYFVKSEKNPKEDPLLLWLTGGPGCSAFSGLAYEIGPVNFNTVEYNGSLPTLRLNPYSWTKEASILFVDSPVGTGFSYARTPHASQTGDFKQVHHLDQFLRKWLMDHPEFISNPFYVGGDSYSGITVPALVQRISNDDWRPWILHSQVAGYTRTYSNQMTYATVKGGGHTAPEYRPAECYAMFQRWINHDPL
ncbi:hypothetical protein AB3S75_012024 [Citrus x aurantiifolia]